MAIEPLRPEDHAFFELVTKFINEANALNAAEHRSRISAAILYAAARYNAFTWMNREIDPEQTPEQAAEFFAGHYKAMFAENLQVLAALSAKG